MKHAIYIALSVVLCVTPAVAGPKRSATVTWTGVTDATGYRLYFGRGSRNYPQSITVNDTTYRVSGLTRGIRYYFAVKAFNNVGSSVYSVEQTYIPQ